MGASLISRFLEDQAGRQSEARPTRIQRGASNGAGYTDGFAKPLLLPQQ